MKKLILKWIVLTASLYISAELTGLVLPNAIQLQKDPNGIVKLFIGVAVLAALNATLGNLLKLLTIPLNCLTLGIVSLVINAAMLMLAGSLSLGFTVDGFLGAFIASILLSAINAVLGSFIKDEEKKSE